MAALVLTEEEVRALVREEVAPLRRELERLRAGAETQITQHEAARRLNVTKRAVERFLKDGRLELAPGPVRMVRWPPRVPPR